MFALISVFRQEISFPKKEQPASGLQAFKLYSVLSSGKTNQLSPTLHYIFITTATKDLLSVSSMLIGAAHGSTS